MSIVSNRRDFLKGATSAGSLFSTRGLLASEAPTPSTMHGMLPAVSEA